MNKFKVGQKVKVITASTGTGLNVNGWTGEIMEVQSDNFVGIKFAEYPLLYCFTDDGVTLDLEVKPTPKWLPIDKDNLPQILVAAINRKEDNPQVYTGALHLNDANNRLYIQSIGGYVRLYDFTHYIPLSDLLNLPIAE
jgi:hypothetical protein